MPVFVTAAYYAVSNPSDFDPALKLQHSEKLVWALRVGSESCERPNLSINSTSFGVNTDNPSFERNRSNVWDGDLYGVYQATYVGWFRGGVLPEVFTASRNLTRTGDVSYDTWRNGFKPVVRYFFLVIGAAAFFVAFFEVDGFLRGKKLKLGS